MSFEAIEQHMKAKKQELDALMAQFQDKMKIEFTNLTKAFFEETGIQAVVWNQYTPYFNDGEECVFSINDPIFVRQNFDPENLEGCAYNYEDDTYNPVEFSSWKRNSSDPLVRTCEAFYDLMQSNEGLLKDIFGDHVTVYLTPEKSVCEEYDHE